MCFFCSLLEFGADFSSVGHGAPPHTQRLPGGPAGLLQVSIVFDKKEQEHTWLVSVACFLRDSRAMAKAASTKKVPAKKSTAKEKAKEAKNQAALKWQVGGLIAGIVVALLAKTEPGQQVRERERRREKKG